MQNDVITYSPTRIAAAYYCGILARHKRLGGGSISNYGIRFGSRIDRCIYLFYKFGIYTPIPELDYVILNSPSVPYDKVEPAEKISFTVGIGSKKFKISGITDLTFPDVVIEIKTGIPRDWHKLQALCYAIAKNRPCRIYYVTKEVFIQVEPNIDELKKAILDAYHNEISGKHSRTVFCKTCLLKEGCPSWEEYSPHLRVIAGLKEIYDSCDDIQKDVKKELKNAYLSVRRKVINLIDMDKAYTVDGYNITPYITKAGRKGLTITKNQYKEPL